MVRLRPSVLAFIFVLKVLANSESGLLKVVFAVIALIVVPSTPVAILRCLLAVRFRHPHRRRCATRRGGFYPGHRHTLQPVEAAHPDVQRAAFLSQKCDAAKKLETFSAKLREETDLGVLNDELISVVRVTMQPAHVSLWLRPSGRIGGRKGEVKYEKIYG
jgi:hypothetical protein